MDIVLAIVEPPLYCDCPWNSYVYMCKKSSLEREFNMQHVLIVKNISEVTLVAYHQAPLQPGL